MKLPQKFSRRHRPCTATFGSCSTSKATLCCSHESLTRTGQGVYFSEQPSKPTLTEDFTYSCYTERILHSSSPPAQAAPVKPTNKLLPARPQDQLCIRILTLPEAPVTPSCLPSPVFLRFPWSCPALLLWASSSAPLTMFRRGGQQEVFEALETRSQFNGQFECQEKEGSQKSQHFPPRLGTLVPGSNHHVSAGGV